MRALTMTMATAVMLVCFAAYAAEGENMLGNPEFAPPYNAGIPNGWNIGRQSAEGKASLSVVDVAPPADSEVAESEDEPATIKAVEFSVENMEWAFLGQSIFVKEPIPAGKTYVFSVWLKAEKPAKVAVINTVITREKNEEGKLVGQNQWGGNQVTTEWQKYTTALTVDDKAKYKRYWPRIQLYTPGVKLMIALPEYVEVIE